jgi:hypothetical protein
MEKRLLVAAGLSLVVLLTWEWIGPKPPKRVAPLVETPAAAAARRRPRVARRRWPRATAAPVPAALPAAASAEAETLTSVSNGVFKATFSNRGAGASSFVLTGHFDEQKQPLGAAAQAAAGFPGRSASISARGRRHDEEGGRGAFVVERESTAWCAGVRRCHDRRRQGRSRREGYLFDVKVTVTGPAYSVLVGPGLRNPTEAERGSRYVMAATAVGETVEG